MSTAGTFQVVAINLSEAKGTVKRPVETALVDERGLVGDAHAGLWHRQISLLGQTDIDHFATGLGRPLEPGEFAENLSPVRCSVSNRVAATKDTAFRAALVVQADRQPPRNQVRAGLGVVHSDRPQQVVRAIDIGRLPQYP